MSKNYQKAARGWLYALAAVIAGTCFSATPAQSATCFLPSGECSTGKIGAGPSGGESTPEYCVGYDITEKEYNAKYNNACWDCSDSCVKTSGGTFYKCKTVNNTTWYDKYNVCCTDGTKYDKDDGKCCAGGKCDHPCSGGKQWSPTLKQCVCPSNVETDGNGNCCASGQVLDENKNCTTPCTPKDCSSYPYTSDPGNSEKCNLGCNKGTRYKCKSGYTYSGGKCVEPPAPTPTPTPKCTDVAATSTRDIISKDYATKEATSQTISTDAVLSCGAENGPSGSLYDYNYTISDSKVSFGGGAPLQYRKHTDGLYYVNLSGYECTQYRCSPLVDGGFYAGLYGSNGNYCCKANAIRDQSSTLRDLRNPSKCKPMPNITPKKHHSLYYVCDSGYTLNGTKCTKAGSYSCPYGYKLNGTTCVSTKTECPEGYEYYGPAGTNKYACVKTVYTCPTNFDYTLSGDKCYCQKPGACLDYPLTSKKDENCYACATCPTDSSKYKCIENIKSGYQLVNGVCSKKPVEKPTITITLEYDSKSNTGSSSGSASALIKFTNSASDGKSYTVKLIIDGDGDDGINYPLTVTQGNWVTYESYSYQLGDCDVYGDCDANWDTKSYEYSSNPTATSVMVNGKTVLSDIAAIDKLAGKTYTTNDYIINFVDNRYIDISYTYTRDGDSSNTWCFEIMSSSPVKKDITVWFDGSYSCYEVDNTLTGEEHTWGHQFQGSVTIEKGSTGAIGSECWQDGSDNNTTRGCNLDKMNIPTPSWDGVKDSDGYTYYWDYQQK